MFKKSGRGGGLGEKEKRNFDEGGFEGGQELGLMVWSMGGGG